MYTSIHINTFTNSNVHINKYANTILLYVFMNRTRDMYTYEFNCRRISVYALSHIVHKQDLYIVLNNAPMETDKDKDVSYI